MPRPKSDLKPMTIKLGEDDRHVLAALASACDPPTIAEAIRAAIRELAARRGISPHRTRKERA